MMSDDDNVIKFPKGENYTLTRQFCECGIVLEYLVDSDGSSFGLCNSCHLGVGDELVQTSDDDGKTRH